ncbi:nitric oxide synthase oxygenase [Streptantibioticus silvisoli]|uniref:Nitric oxide synthase oxygenase n=1 Tax=Streptantibioticus silvisoli TaxID=2705255 RepID=A0ABT6W659_9ACTN|nr:nitric oxide synthase oxygenase [Streptantibioticus silvisoli]MDI5966237.1 nitric oxide synthase oxygenase [Streptantibioticus silvisoli]
MHHARSTVWPGDTAGPGAEAGSAAVADHRQALDFLRQYFRENPVTRAGELRRMRDVSCEIEHTGTYRHTGAELAWGARVAWRNSARCIGRLYWNNLNVRDLRDVKTAEDIAEGCFEHLRSSWRGGRIRPTITVFPAEQPDGSAVRIWNDQLIRYAGRQADTGATVGDGQYLRFTRLAERLGWRGAGGRFDVLPLLIETAAGLSVHPVPDDAVREVPLEHPEFGWFGELGLRWHAIPAISNMRLEIGGVHYTAAPFNGWYMQTEIAARNLVDAHRYDTLPRIGERMGLDMSSERTLWRDRAMLELNRAVLHSFDAAGVSLSDHHTESRRFLDHLAREERAGRSCPADWSWIVPPVSGGLTPVYHRYYDEADLRPAFVLDDPARERGQGTFPVRSAGGCPFS